MRPPLGPLLNGDVIEVHGDLDAQMVTHEDGEVRLCLMQGGAVLVLDAHHVAHLAVLLRDMVNVQVRYTDGDEPVDTPNTGG